MKRILVSSSNIRSVGFKSEGNQKGTLEIEFIANNMIYRFDDVPSSLHDGFLTAKSKGQFFNENIKSKYVGKKVEKEEASDAALRAGTRIRDLFTLAPSIYAIKVDEVAHIIDEELNRRTSKAS